MQVDDRRERLGPFISSPEASKLPKATILWPGRYPTLLRYFREAALAMFVTMGLTPISTPCKKSLRPDARLLDAEAYSAISRWKHLGSAHSAERGRAYLSRSV